MKVLVVDDSGTMRKIVMKGVQGALGECEFIQAGDGIEGLEALGKNPDVDLVLSDINMPNMDGIEFVRNVRDLKVTERVDVADKELTKKVCISIPIIMVSTEGGLEKVQEAMAAGANDYVKKPFTPEDLKEKLAPLVSG